MSGAFGVGPYPPLRNVDGVFEFDVDATTLDDAVTHASATLRTVTGCDDVSALRITYKAEQWTTDFTGNVKLWRFRFQAVLT